MKKIVIIVSVILLSRSFCFGQEIAFETPSPKIIKLNVQFKGITLQNIKKDDVKNNHLAISSSDSTVVKYNTIVFNSDSTKANISVTGIGYGFADIEVKAGNNSIQRRIFVSSLPSIDTTLMVMADTITSLRTQLLLPKEAPIPPNDTVTVPIGTKTLKEQILNTIPFILAALLLVLLGLLFFFYNKIKANKKDIKDLEKTIEDYTLRIDDNEKKLREQNNLTSEKGAWENEERRLKDRIGELQNEIDKLKKNSEGSTIIPHKSSPPPPPPAPQPQSLYADAIIEGKFNRVQEQPDDDTIFELKLNKLSETRANVTIYAAAHRRVIARPSFLDGCDKQILGNTAVIMLREGVATKDGSGKWNITITPEVKIS